MRYLSVCSGIEAATVAWEPLGFTPVAFAEIEKFPNAVLAHHYRHVPNLGDIAKINGADFNGKIDILVGGTPCQSFSIAGLRKGLKDERGGVIYDFIRIADETNPAFIVWENVPGVLSDRGNAFGCFLGAISGENVPLEPPGGRWSDAGCVLGKTRSIAWRILDAQYFGVAQRRRRVFAVGCPREGADPRKILFESKGLRRDTPPCRKTGEAATTEPKGENYCGSIPACANTLTKRMSKGPNSGCEQTLVGGERVRALTPRECERLQGFPDDYTLVPWRKGLATDTNRYAALGNSMAVPVMQWIGESVLQSKKRG